MVNTLQERNLIEEGGRKDVVGRPMTYKTTKIFLESFGLNSMDDLPPLELEPGQPLELNLLNAQTQAADKSGDEPALDDSADGAPEAQAGSELLDDAGAGATEPIDPATGETFSSEERVLEDVAYDDLSS